MSLWKVYNFNIAPRTQSDWAQLSDWLRPTESEMVMVMASLLTAYWS